MYTEGRTGTKRTILSCSTHFGITGVEIQIYWYYTAGIVDFEI